MFMKRISTLFTSTMARRPAHEDWLARSGTIAELERRQREILRARFSGW